MKIIILIMLGLSLLQADYLRDNTKELVLDTTTNLIWQDDNDTKTLTKNWEDALIYCEAKSLGGFSDWRLANKNELETLINRSSSPMFSVVFQNNSGSYYWSSTTSAATTTSAWKVSFSGYGDVNAKTGTAYVLCVR